ncbi:MAG: serine hydrolase [Bacillota bacterium]
MEKAVKELIDQSTGQVSVVIKSGSGKVYINSDAPMRAASTIKLALLFEACRQIASGKLSGEQKIKLVGKEPTAGAGVLDHLHSLEELILWDILSLMIIVSDNAASNAVLDLLGKENINKACDDLGLINTKIERKFMDFSAAERGLDNQTSAGDMVRLLEAFLAPGVLPEQERKCAIQLLGNHQSRKLTAAIEEDEVQFFGKSGELKGLQADVGIFGQGENSTVAAVFIEGADNPLCACQLIAKIGLIIHQKMKSIA